MAHGPMAQQPLLDRRGNDVNAVRRESTWATQVWQHVTPEQMQHFVSHLQELVHIGKLARQKTFASLPRMPREEVDALMARFNVVDTVERSLNEWAMTNGSGPDLAQRLLDNKDFKELVDVVGGFNYELAPRLHDAMRSPVFFTDRGRQLMPESQVRESSVMSRHAGITEGIHRSPSTENFFTKDIMHAKGDIERLPQSRTSARFSQVGMPFIGGISGSGQFIAQHIEMQKPFQQRTPMEKAQAEQLMLMHAALMTAGGHHSVMETVLSARTVGFFADIPNPLRNGGSYAESIRALGVRARQLGLATPSSLG
ncbi:hypothetical protein [Pandoraea anhela]|nr:hypothetical protein [Pandoraea anhela]